MNITQVQNIQLSPDNNLISILDDRYVLKPDIQSDVEEPMFQSENLEISSEADLILVNSIIIVALTIPMLGMLFAFVLSTTDYLMMMNSLKILEPWFDSWPTTHLMVASYFGHYIIGGEIEHMFLESESDPNARNYFGDTALHFAACNDNPKIVEILLQRGAYINARNRDKNTPLHIAVQKENPLVVAALLRNGARTELKNIDRDTALHIAARKGNTKVVELLLKSGANANLKNERLKETPLDIAVNQGNPRNVQMLLKHGADINRVTVNLLEIAAEKGNPELLEVLLRTGIDPNLKNEYGESPLGIAVKQGNARNVQILLQHGADVNEIQAKIQRGFSNKRWNPLHVAAYNGNSEIAEILLKNGARTDLKTYDGETAMDLALKHERGQFYEIVDLLKNLPK